MKTISTLLAAVAVVMISNPVNAVPIAQYFVVLPQSPGIDPAEGGTAQISIDVPGRSYRGTAASFGPAPTLHFDYAMNQAVTGPGLSTQAGLSYFFEVTGTVPQPLADVVALDLRVIGSLMIVASGLANTDVTAQVRLLGLSGTTLFSRRACVHNGGQACAAGADAVEIFDEELTFFVDPGRTYQLNMLLLGQTNFFGPGSTTAVANLDPLPVFSDIDPVLLGLPPGYRFADEFAIAFSPNVGAAPSDIPEPSALALFAIAALALGRPRRRYRNCTMKLVPAAASVRMSS